MKKLSPLKKTSSFLTVAIVAISFYGCGINSKSNYTINPDLSGKCVFEEKAGLDMAMITTFYGGFNSTEKDASAFTSILGGDTTTPTPHEILMGFASKILNNKGVETWKDIEIKMIGTDTVYFKGTAYFKNIKDGGLSGLDTDMRVYNNDQGQTVIEMKEGTKKDTASSASANIYKNLFKGGLYYSMMHYYMAMFLRDFSISITYNLPGKIVSVSNFKKLGDNSAEFAFNGKTMIHYLDTLMRNTDLMTKMYSNPTGMGSLSSSDPYRANSYIFGEDKPVRLVYKAGNKPLFDYDKEVAEAKKYYAAFRKKLGLDEYDSLQQIKKELQVAEMKKQQGTLVLTKDDSANGKTYFKTLAAKQYSRGYISFTGELSKPVYSGYYSTVSITSATMNDNTSILDSIQNPTSISAYAFPSAQSYNDSLGGGDKTSFSVSGSFPDKCKFINLEGVLKVDSVTTVPFKIINLYLLPKTGSSNDGE